MNYASRLVSEDGLSRREFLVVSGLAGGGLAIGMYLAARGGQPADGQAISRYLTALDAPGADAAGPALPMTWLEPNVFLKIGTDGTVTITVHKSEMGQGVRTSLPMLVAEELEADWTTIQVEQGGVDQRFGNQETSGSTSTPETYTPLRRAGAVARVMLIAAAAQIWRVEKETCFAERGKVIHRPSGMTLTFGELVATAATLDVPSSSDIRLKDRADFKLIGTRVPRIDDPQIIEGSAIFGLDTKVPGMLYAAVARSPVLSGSLGAYAGGRAQSVAGVRWIGKIDNGVAVVAENTWAALQGRDALETTWLEGSSSQFSTAGLREALMARANEDAALGGGEQTIQAIYEVPYFAHATMEPMNCVADVRQDRCDVWVPTQSPQEARRRAKEYTNLPDEAIHVHVSLLGGGFGRRIEADYVGEAVQISKAVGAPVQVVWTREDDMHHDFYHPFTLHLAEGRLDKPALPDVTSYSAPGGVRTGAWRSVTNIPSAYVRECFLDEMAGATGMDPVDIRKALEPEMLQEVLEVAVRESGWGLPLPAGWGRGVACHASWDATPVAIVAEVSVGVDDICRVHRVVCAVDCGIVVNPGMVEAQMEGGIVFGLTAVLRGKGITFEGGRVQQRNFDDYPLIRFDETPEIEVYIVSSGRNPRGVGEMSTPPLIPAIANAIFEATGRRIRHIPILPEDLVGAGKPPVVFPDVAPTDPYVTAIYALADRHIIDGYANGNFGPYDAVTRQQFSKMIVLTADLPVSEGDACPFPDVSTSTTGLYPDHIVAVAATSGITTGYADGTFRPDREISRGQVITMVVRASEDLHPGLLDDPPASYASSWGSFDPIHGPKAAKAEFNGLLAGLAPPGSTLQAMNAWGSMPRGEVAQVLHNLLRLVE